MKLTLLQMVQSILSSMGSDEVNSISDTTESLQVADIVKQTYINMLGRYDLPSHNELFQLTATDLTTPVLMRIPPGCQLIDWIKYLDTNPADSTNLQVDQFGAYSKHDTNVDLVANANGWSTTSITSNTIGTGTYTFTVGSGLTIKPSDTAFVYATGFLQNNMNGIVVAYNSGNGQLTLNITQSNGAGTFTAWNITQQGGNIVGPQYKEIRMIPVNDFVVMVNSQNNADANVNVFSYKDTNNSTGLPQSFTFYYRNDLQPQYCCILSNNDVIFDSYDSSQDSCLQSSKTMVMGWNYPPFQMIDSWIAPIEEQQFGLFLADAKALAFVELKQMPHQRAEREVQRQVTSLQKFKSVANVPSYFDQLPNYGRRWSGRYWNGVY